MQLRQANGATARRTGRVALVVALAAALCVVATRPAHAANAGDLDTSFGSGGKVQTDLGQKELIFAMAVQGDGRIVVAGRQDVAAATPRSNILLARYLTNGQLDTSFGKGGVVLDSVAGYPLAAASGVAVQADGRIVVSGTTNDGKQNDSLVGRYLADGTRDAGFGASGIAVNDLGSGANDTGNAVALVPDGSIAVAIDAPTASTGWSVAFFDQTGTLIGTEPGFATGAVPNGLAITPDGKVVAAGYATPGRAPDFGFVRYATNHRPDTTFGAKSLATVDFAGGDDEAFGAAVGADGSVFGAGYATLSSGVQAGAVVKLTPAGAPDPSFGQNGKVTVDFGQPATTTGAVALQPDGSVLIAGETGTSASWQFALARLTKTGALDSTFGQGGLVRTSFTGTDTAYAVRLTPTGLIVAAGSARASAGDIAIARYLSTATAVTSVTTTSVVPTATTAKPATTTTAPPNQPGAAVTTTTAPPSGTAAGEAPPAAPDQPGTAAGPTDNGALPVPGRRPQLLVSAARAGVGSRVTASAFNAPATGCARVFFLVDHDVAASAPRDADGTARAPLHLDDSLLPGRHRVASSCSRRATDTFATASISVAASRRSAFVRSLRPASALSTDRKVLAANALLALLLVILIAFPAELFNSTLDEHYEEVTGWLAPWRRRRAARQARASATAAAGAASGGPASPWTSRLQLAGFLVAGGIVYGLLDPGFGLNRASIALVLGLVIGLGILVVTFSAAQLVHARRRLGERGHFATRPGSIVVALVCVLASRLLHFEPGYLFGLIGGYVVQRELPRNEEGAVTAASAVVVLLTGAVAWLAWVPISHRAARPGSSLALLVLDATLAAVFVSSLEGLAMGLLPLRFLNGERVMAWNRWAWAGLFGVSMFVFVHALLHPEDGYVSTSPRASVLTVIALVVAFGLGSVAFWSYFRFRRPRTEARVV